MRLKGYIGTSTLFGRDIDVEYRDGRLSLDGFAMEESQRVIDALEKLSEKMGKGESTPASEPAPQKPASGGLPVEAVVGLLSKMGAAKGGSVPEASQPPQSDSGGNGRAGPSTPAPTPLPPSTSTNVPIPPPIQEAKRLSHILAYLLENGVERTELVDECQKLKPNVPLLNRIEDMADRVGRTLEAMEAAGDA